ncbi:MAG: two-component system sensor histidine kinase NtrB [Hyphomicrobium sp.]
MPKRQRRPAPDDSVATALRAGFENAHDAMAIVGPDDELIAVNAAFTRCFDQLSLDTLASGIAAIFLDETEARRAMTALRASCNAVSPLTATLRGPKGQPVVANVDAVMFTHAKKGRSGVLLTIAFKSDSAGTARFTEQSRRDALELLAAGIAHDFRNVLAVIKGNVEIAEQRSSDPRVKSLLLETERAASLGAAMTNELLAFAGRSEKNTKRIDIARALSNNLEMMRMAAGAKVDIQLTVAPDLGFAAADDGNLQRALINLVANARDAMPAGGAVTIDARGTTIDQPTALLSGILNPGRYAQISMTDAGPGMSDSVRRRALDPFFTTKAPGQGFGLGMALVRSFAVEAGGGIDLTNAASGGTAAVLYLKSL